MKTPLSLNLPESLADPANREADPDVEEEADQ